MSANYGDLAFVKEVLGITDTSKDAFLTTLLEQATEVFKTLIDRDLDLQEYIELIAGTGRQRLNVFNYPVTEIKEVNKIVAPELVEVEDLTTEVINQQNPEDLNSGVIFKDDIWDVANYYNTKIASRQIAESKNFKIIYMAGYDPIPLDIQWFISNLAIDQYTKYKVGNLGGVQSITQGRLSYTFKSSLTSDEGMALVERYERKSYEF